MFLIDKTANRITKLEETKFSNLGFGERTHLQEWLAHQSDALGEELLIIQKEFAGFDETKERLDLLAIDKAGNLVVIENKLDDSGRDVVWQSLKYASYCSTLSKTNVVSIFQQYLDRSGKSGNAQELLCDFLEEDDFTEVKLNPGNNQRIILVAGQFRKEVTSTVLWLAKHGVAIKCFKATPFRYEQQYFLKLDQVIPLAEAEELMIGISEKEAEENAIERVDATRHLLRMEFWRAALDALEKAKVQLYANVSPSRDHWLSAGAGLSGVHYSMIFGRSEARVEFVFSAAKEINKARFDALHEQRDALEKRFGHPLEWRRLDGKKASSIVFAQDFDGYNRDSWPDMTEWLVAHISKLHETIEPEINRLRNVRVVER